MTTNTNENPISSKLISHLVELRQRLIYSLLAVGIMFIVLFYFAAELYQLLALPLLQQLPDGQQLIATGVASPLFAPLKLSFALSILICLPFLFYQLWTFVAPGLYPNERQLFWPLLFSSVLLFYLGMVFAYFVVFPLIFGFFTAVAPAIVTVTPDISEYLNFTLKLFFAFGVAFEVPVATVLLIRTRVVSIEQLQQARPYVIVGAFVLGMLLTPPDVLSQVLLALPMWLLFELGILVGRRI